MKYNTLREQIINNIKLDDKIYVLTGSLVKVSYSVKTEILADNSTKIDSVTTMKTIYRHFSMENISNFNFKKHFKEYLSMCEGGFGEIEILNIEVLENITLHL